MKKQRFIVEMEYTPLPIDSKGTNAELMKQSLQELLDNEVTKVIEVKEVCP
jgi:hypothetical protein